MIKQFKVGDIIIYKGVCHIREIGLKQGIYEISEFSFHTEFIDDGDYEMKGKKNSFSIDSIYHKECYSIGNNFEYENGVPLIWEGII